MFSMKFTCIYHKKASSEKCNIKVNKLSNCDRHYYLLIQRTEKNKSRVKAGRNFIFIFESPTN